MPDKVDEDAVARADVACVRADQQAEGAVRELRVGPAAEREPGGGVEFDGDGGVERAGDRGTGRGIAGEGAGGIAHLPGPLASVVRRAPCHAEEGAEAGASLPHAAAARPSLWHVSTTNWRKSPVGKRAGILYSVNSRSVPAVVHSPLSQLS